jgi:cellulose synthase/poly-beta-1,6-N-acetylglucosamine synthase-like glycosyltransferase
MDERPSFQGRRLLCERPDVVLVRAMLNPKQHLLVGEDTAMLSTLLSFTALTISAALSIPSAVFAVECVAATTLRRKPVAVYSGKRPSIGILVPAHNEELGISKTLLSIRAEMHLDDRLVVVADNCTDDTALLARTMGAEVVERNNERQRGKGFALDAGVAYLADNAPDIVVIIDADCYLRPGTLDRLAGKVSATGGPVQACYLMLSPSATRIDLAVREFAFLVKNRVRPLGMSKLGLPCQLTGSGMAFPWALINTANLSNDNIVEDMKLGLELARSGHSPRFCDDAFVVSEFPYSRSGSATQYRRWESGHLAMIRAAMNTLTERGVLGNLGLLAQIMDVMVPPLALLVLLLGSVLVFSGLLALAGLGTLAFVVAFVNLLMVTIGIAAAWLTFGTKILPPRKLYAIPYYVARKAQFYAGLVRGERARGWIRTDRRRND